MEWEPIVKVDLRMKGMVLLMMYTQTSALDAAQATDLLGRIMELSTAATTAATTANQMLEALNSGRGKGAPRFGDVAKLLQAPEVFDTDGLVKYTSWREQLAHFLYGRYSDLMKDVEQLETMTAMATLEALVQELAMKLYSILSSHLQGPALQIVRAHSSQRWICSLSSAETALCPTCQAEGIGHWPLDRPSCNIQPSLSRDLCWRTCCSSTCSWTSMHLQLDIECLTTSLSVRSSAAWVVPHAGTWRGSWTRGWTMLP